MAKAPSTTSSFPDQDAKSPRVTGKGASTTIAFRAAQVRRLHLFLQRARTPARRHAGAVHRHAAAAGADAWSKPTFRASPTDLPPPIGKREPQTVRVDLLTRRARRPPRGRHDVRLLDLQRQGAGTVHPRARRRHGRHSSEELGRQLHDPFGRFPCRHRPGRRRRGAAGRSRRREIDDAGRRWCPASMSIIAPRRWSPSTSPTACTA